MDSRVARGLFRLWVVASVLWIVGTAAYVTNSYQTVSLRDLKKGLNFDDLVPAYAHCWDYRTTNLAGVAECERSADRSDIIKQGVVIAFGIPVAIFVLGWAMLWAYRGLLPNKS
jgi:hypothetical protein